MHRAGAHVSVAPLSRDHDGCSGEFRRLVAESPARVDGPVLYSASPGRPEFDCLLGTDLFARITCESSRIPEYWAARLNRTRAVMVPSRYVADVYRAGGVTVPIYVVPDGVDPDIYPYARRFRQAGLTTLMVLGEAQTFDPYREGIAAWQEAFRDDRDARLVILSRQGWPDSYLPADPRIHVETLTEPTRSRAHWYAEADVFLALGDESFGATTAVEAMSSGLTVVVLNAEGQADLCRDAGELVLSVEPVTWRPDYHPDGAEFFGVRAVPEVADIAARLRWVARHRAEAAELGRAAADWVRAHRNVWNDGPAVLAVMENHTRTRKPLRDSEFPGFGPMPRLAAADVPAARTRWEEVVRAGDPPLWRFRPEGGASLGVVTLWTPQIEGWARKHAEDKRAYCERHGFAFYGYADVFTTSRAPHWSKITAVQRHLADHDWLFWTDADAAITNFDVDLRELCDDYDLIVTHDELGLNTGSFLIRNNAEARELLRRTWIQDVSDLFYEQTAMARAIALQPGLRVKVLEKRSMNAFWSEFEPGDFIIHAAGQPTEVKIAMLDAFRASAVRR
ncbi:galactosyl transferase GMA12/MNN10 family protein [Nocardia mexicana]|uniref:Galactosyl transferase GMA12/MNN10 family protein n=1 Tax=Nocardia mexicana TaxID=279262 RepID=A0A370H9A0_9NOCA|nr:galactosyl transferase GMA12/MNN10 family protein [Nocardia mexicana]